MEEIDNLGMVSALTTEHRLGASGFRRRATLMSAAFATAGLASLAYFSLASHAIDDAAYKRITLLWSIVILVVALIYRPVEQLISRSIAADLARRVSGATHLRTPLILQASFALTFVVVSLIARQSLQDDLFDGSSTLFWLMVGAVVAFAFGYAVRGWLGGHGQFGLYGVLVITEAISRTLFPAAVLIGVASGETAVALGVLAAPLIGVLVVMVSLLRWRPRMNRPSREAAWSDFRQGGSFTRGAFTVLLAEQFLLTAGIFAAEAQSSGSPVAGFVFNAMVIARAAAVLFQAVQASLLPHLAALGSDPSEEAHATFGRLISDTGRVSIALGLGLAAILLVAGPLLMSAFFGSTYLYSRVGLGLVALGAGFHLFASSRTQGALARAETGRVARGWLLAAAAFGAWLALPLVANLVLRVEIGYAGAAILLAWRIHTIAPVRTQAARTTGGID